MTTNALSEETSPYLLQHADNPVDWYPWGPEALALARRERKPILLSIGYSACHWCHVMAHESFEDPAIAALMNSQFINIKVDREERPDLDRIYQTAHQLLSRRPGGWPLTVFLSPDDQLPFFAGTYFPPQERHGMIGFPDLLLRIAAAWHDQPDQIHAQNEQLRGALSTLDRISHNPSVVPLDGTPLSDGLAQAQESFDERYGGFGDAPKFPHPTSLERLLRHAAARPTDDLEGSAALHMALYSLERMAAGGINDQLGGGFYRYSVDARWQIPHFEKMLYDNAQLLSLYAWAFRLSGQRQFERTARAIAGWMIADMQDDDGAFYSSRDADSEGEEGQYYLWQVEQVAALLNEREFNCFSRRFGLDQPPNFEGHWHLTVHASAATIAREQNLPEAEVESLLASASDKLLASRAARIPPARDDKILTAWNGLAIKSLAVSARLLNDTMMGDAAQRALDSIKRRLWRDGRLLATCRGERARLPAYLDDYAFLLDATLALLELRWRAADLDFALQLADTMLANFVDTENGGFYFTAHDHERLVMRTRAFQDDAIPAGNGIAAMALGRLGHLLGDTRYLAAAGDTLKAGADVMQRYPWSHNAMLNALEEFLSPPAMTILRGNETALARWQQALRTQALPRQMVLAIPAAADTLPQALAARAPRGDIVGYVCRGMTCSAPAQSLDELQAALTVSAAG
ncbi:MAG: thioredoxin domain-containing protein [Gammaproteobacteria bacterium]|nr:thioredoxin domain-containing protein [Gammaproteobacteria bacterium]